MKKAWLIVLTVVGIVLAFAALCIIVGFITGAEPQRIYSGFETIFEQRYNIDLDALINTWIPQVIETITGSI